MITFYFPSPETFVSEHLVDHLVLKFILSFLIYYSHIIVLFKGTQPRLKEGGIG